MIQRGHLDVPIVGVAKDGNLDQLRARARDSLGKHGGVEEKAFAQLSANLRYVAGDYQDPATFDHLREALGDAARPLHYLAVPPPLFATVAAGLSKSGCAKDARVVVEKPFGHDLASARALNRSASPVFPRVEHLPHRSLPRQRTGAESAVLPLRQLLPRADLEPQLRGERADHHGRKLRDWRP